MTRLASTLVAGVTAAALLTSGFVVPASAAVDDVPQVRVKIRSITLDTYTGNASVVARVKCTETVAGIGSASWEVRAVQDVRAKASATIPCDGRRHRDALRLIPRQGDFHSGPLNVTLTTTAAGSRLVEINSSTFDTTI